MYSKKYGNRVNFFFFFAKTTKIFSSIVMTIDHLIVMGNKHWLDEMMIQLSGMRLFILHMILVSFEFKKPQT